MKSLGSVSITVLRLLKKNFSQAVLIIYNNNLVA